MADAYLNMSCFKDLAMFKLNSSDMRVFFWVLNKMDNYAHVKVNRPQVAQELGITILTLSRSLQRLVSYNFLVRNSKGIYRLNPEWSGVECHEDSKTGFGPSVVYEGGSNAV